MPAQNMKNLSRRDYFAGLAMQAFIQNRRSMRGAVARVAADSFEIADHMVEAGQLTKQPATGIVKNFEIHGSDNKKRDPDTRPKRP